MVFFYYLFIHTQHLFSKCQFFSNRFQKIKLFFVIDRYHCSAFSSQQKLVFNLSFFFQILTLYHSIYSLKSVSFVAKVLHPVRYKTFFYNSRLTSLQVWTYPHLNTNYNLQLSLSDFQYWQFFKMNVKYFIN